MKKILSVAVLSLCAFTFSGCVAVFSFGENPLAEDRSSYKCKDDKKCAKKKCAKKKQPASRPAKAVGPVQ